MFDLYQRADYQGALEMYSLVEDSKLKDTFMERCREKIETERKNKKVCLVT